MDPREELMALRRMAELEAKAYGQAAPAGEIPMGRTASTQEGTMGAYVSRQPAAEPTMTQKVYQAVRPFVAPVVEAGGAIGGGILGAGAGTFGAGPVGTAVGGISGAGLGYGAAKELMQLADVNLGGQPQRVGAAQFTEPLRNVAEGATMEVGGQLAGKTLGYAAKKVVDLRQIPIQKAATIARNALGPDMPAVLNALKSSQGQNVTAGQAVADINSPTFQALMDRAVSRDPRFMEALKASQGEISVNALAKLAGGTTATETRAATEAAKSNLNAITSPMRETAISGANLGKYVADEAASRQANDLAVLVGTGSKIDPAQFLAQATGAEKALRSAGVKPLEGTSLADKIASIPNNPQFAANDLVEGSTQQVADAIRKWTAGNGVIDANALEAIRKNAVNAAIAKLRPGADATTQRNLAAGVLSKIKPAIDDAIESAGGTGWRDYLSTHAKGMQKINEQKLTGEALNLWKTNKDAFVKLVQNESPDVVEKFLGPGKYNIAQELADSTLTTLQNQATKALRDIKVSGQVAAGQDALKEVLLDNLSKFRIPSYITAVAATTNKALSILENKIGKATMNALTEASKTPGGAVKLLETLPANERNRVIQLLSNPQQWKPGVTTAATNALAPQQENQNALIGQ